VAGLLTEPPWLGQETGHSERFPEELRRYEDTMETMIVALGFVLRVGVPVALLFGVSAGLARWDARRPAV